ncbi:MAG: hypothetical protein N3D84_02025 [Candidatus Woesearchaeota archaeon]|nr:hypothetical protein [Candidatus Woesearchaeota archaeon]
MEAFKREMTGTEDYERAWELNNAPVLWVETIYEGGTRWMKKFFGISYKDAVYCRHWQCNKSSQGRRFYRS